MAKRESNFPNMVITLLVVTLVAGGALGFVHDMTKEAIETAKLNAQNEAIGKVLPPFDELKTVVNINSDDGQGTLEIFPAYKNGIFVGAAVKTFSNKGFSGYISIMAGIDASGMITGYEILEHKETPGLGSKMGEWFKNLDKPRQMVIGKSPATARFQVSKDGGDIDAITASTITSRAFLDALVKAHIGFTNAFPSTETNQNN